MIRIFLVIIRIFLVIIRIFLVIIRIFLVKIRIFFKNLTNYDKLGKRGKGTYTRWAEILRVIHTRPVGIISAFFVSYKN